MPDEKEPLPNKSVETNTAKPPFKAIILWMLLLGAVIMMFHVYSRQGESIEMIDFSPTFAGLVEEKRVNRCEIVTELSGNQYITGTLLDIDKATGKPRKFRVETVITERLPEWLRENNVRFSFRRQKMSVWQLVQGAVPFLVVIGLLYFLFMRQMRSMGQGALNFGRSRAKMLVRDENRTTFTHVAGVEEAKEEVQEIVEFLKDPKKFQKLGGRMPKGVLLMGPPGTGKTLLAKAIAGEADVPFFSISGSDFVEMFVGVGAARVRDMFEQGKKSAPCLIFIDEIDAVGRSRFSGIGGGHDEREQTLNALLVEMDGFEAKDGVIIIAATNRPDVLDPALLRPGRFDRQIVIDLPILEGRLEILKIHAKNVKMALSVDLMRVARGTSGFSGADLANLINEAALLAARQNKDSVDLSDLEEARDKVRWGRERRSRVMDEEEKKLTAYHETGHAIVMQLTEKSEPLHKITIIPRGTSYLGATMQLPLKDRYTQSRIKLKSMLAGLMGGRAAEEMVFSDITTGAGSDLKEATRLARLMVCNWGMSEELGPQTFGTQEEVLFLGREVIRNQDVSEDAARRIDVEVNALLREAFNRARQILTDNREKMDLVAKTLIERETLDGREVEELLKHGRILSEEERAENDKTEKTDKPQDAAAPAEPETGALVNETA